MNFYKIKKILAFMTTFTMVVSNTPTVLAANNELSEFISDNMIMCGYNQIYRDGAGSSWAPEKPEMPEVSRLEIKFNSQNQGDEYSFKLIDKLDGDVITSINGQVEQSGDTTILLEIPGDTKSGTYNLIGKVGTNEETTKDIIIKNNLALNAELGSTEVNDSLNKVNDLTIANYTAKGGSTSKQEVMLDTPVDMTFKLNNYSTLEHIDIYSNNVENHGPIEFKVFYKDENSQEIEVGTFNNLTWESYINNETGAPRKRTTIQLNEPIRTNELKVSLTKTNQDWGNKYVIDEIMLWGYEDNDDYRLSVEQDIGIANQANTITLTGRAIGNLENEELDIKLIKDSEEIKTESVSFNNGNLEHNFVTPDNIESGNYQLVVVSRSGKINKTFNYVVRRENTYESNIDANLTAYSGNNKIENLFDGDYSTSYNTSSLKVWGSKSENDEVFSIRSIKVYLEKDSVKNAELLIATNARKNESFARIVNLNNINWQNDEKGDYIELYVQDNFLSHAYELKFNTAVDIKELDVTGVYFEENLLKNAKVTYKGEKINGYNIFDNIINSELIINGQNAQGTNEMLLSFEDGNIYELSQLFLSSNYSESQGVKSVQVSYLKDGKWIELDKITPKYLTGQEQRRQMCVINLPNIQTIRLKLKLEFNTTWNKGIITELNAVGRKYESGQAIAELINHVDELNSSTKKLSLNWLEEIDKNHESKYSYSLVSSTNESVIDLSGNIYHTDKDENVTVVYKVIDKEGNEYRTNNIDVHVPKALGNNLTQAELQIDKTTAYNNPAMGWVAYVEGFECAVHEQYGDTIHNPNAQDKGLCLQIDDAADAQEYWKQIDGLIQGGMPINILYIRQPWSWFEPTEGNYAWNDPNSACSVLVEGARNRGIQLAFRVLTCSSACKQQATPQYVFDAGATGVTRNYDYIKNVKDPHLDNNVFQEKFKKFVNTFGKEFNREDTAFIDANGHGEWGEMNANVDVTNGGNKGETVDKLAQFYVDAFPDVLLGGQLGSSQGRDKINESFKVDGKNFVIRRDAFGSPRWLPGDEPKINEVRNNGVPLFAENCYHHFNSRDFRWSSVIDYPADGGGVNEYGGDDPYITMDAMMNKVVDDAIRLRANTIDLRVLEDCKLWLSDGQDYLDRFTKEGGYRISITDATYTNTVKAGESINIDTIWQNNGVGIVPNKNKRWNNKMKVAYALIDSEGQIVQQEIISTDKINVGDFEKGQDYSYKNSFVIDENVKTGTYRLAVSILNEKDNFKLGLQLSNKGEMINGTWLTLGDVEVNGRYTLVEQVVEGKGTISFDKEELLIGKSSVMTITPEKGYEISYVEVNGEEIKLTDNKYTFDKLPYRLNIKVVFKSVLELVIEHAEELKMNGALENVIPVVIEEFELALEDAKIIIGNENASESERDAVTKRLLDAINKLEYKKGDKTELINLIEIIEALDKSKYTPSTWKVLQNEIENAKKVIEDENAMEDKIASVYEKLTKAFSGLVLAADKSQLEKLVSELDELDKSKYTKESVKKLKSELVNAKDILKDEEVIQEAVDEAVRRLELAFKSLELKRNDNNSSNGNSGNSGNSGNNGNTNNNSNASSNDSSVENLPNTGGISSLFVIASATILTLVGLVLSKKKKYSK